MSVTQRPNRGIAIVSVLVMMLVLMMLVNALIILARQQALVSRTAYDREAALFTAEAAVAEVQSRLEIDPSREDDLVGQSMEAIPGEFTIRWNTTGKDFESWESVNNLSSWKYADSYRGKNTVPPWSALLVVTARVGTTERICDVLLTRSGTVNTSRPMVASGDVEMQGNVRVDGIVSLATGGEVAAGIHSGTKPNADGTITWTKSEGTDYATVEGKVSTVNSNAGAIDFFGDNPDDHYIAVKETGASPVSMRKADIPKTIWENRFETKLGPGTTLVAPGEWYHPGDLEVHGDLTLDGAALYVEGKLKVNGSIRGRGSLYVGEETIFQGDSQMQAKDALHVGLFSEGSVQLTGFDGTAYLDDMAKPGSPNYDPDVGVWWPEAKDTLEDLQTLLRKSPKLGDMSAADKLELASMLQKLGESDSIIDPPYGEVGGDIDVLGKIRGKVQLRDPAGPTEEFLVDKLGSLQSLFQLTDEAGAPYTTTNFETTGDPTGLLYAVVQSNKTALWTAATNLAQQTEFDKIGTSHFNGVVYTAGGFYAENEVNILGALVAFNDQNGTTTFPDGTQVDWGDITIKTGTRVTYVLEYFDSMVLTSPGAGYVTVQAWLGR